MGGAGHAAHARNGSALVEDRDRAESEGRGHGAPAEPGGAGRFDGIAWSPDGRWLVVGWPTADQWVFVRSDGKRISATADVSAQFRSGTFPRVEGWCC